MNVKVCKFGGTSMASAEQFRKVADIVLAEPSRRIVVVSAPGKRDPSDRKVTDLLIAYAEGKLTGESGQHLYDAIMTRFRDISEGLGLDVDLINTIGRLIQARAEGNRSNRARYMDGIKALGEEMSARILANYLQKIEDPCVYIDPKDAGLVLSDEPGNAHVLSESYDNLKTLRISNKRIVFPGFFGYSREGNLVAFPRGGSDITGAILAAAIDADLYENYTDVDCVFAVDPNIVKSPASISELTYAEMRELSYAGFSVFHDEALEPAFRAQIPVQIKNTNNPQAVGTRISMERSNTEMPVVGIASSSQFCTLFLSKYLMNREKGFGRRLLQIIEEESLSFEHCPSGIDSISVILREGELTLEKEANVLERIREELQPDRLLVKRGLSLVMIVGDGMSHRVGIAMRATSACANADVNLEMINQGASENSIMFGIRDEDRKQAVRALHREFFEITPPTVP